MTTLLAAAREGRSGALLVVGEPGVGKTALLEDVVRHADGLQVVRATGFETETDLAFAGLAAILGGFVDIIDRLPGPQGAALAGALGVGPPLPPGDRFTVYAGALSLLAEAANDGPLLVMVDDAHWLDPATLDALAFVARRIAGEGIGMIIAARHEPPTMTRRSAGIPVLDLRGLDPGPGARLLESHSDAPVDPHVARRIVGETAGNPLALVEVARTLSAPQLSGSEPMPDHLPVGDDLTRAFASDVETLPEPTRRALLLAAAGAGDPGLVDAALGTAGLRHALGPAETQGVVRLDGHGVMFRHPLVRAAVYRSAPAAARREAHTALARAADARGDSGAETAARHRAAAADGPDEQVATALHGAARQAAARMGYAEAATLTARAAALTPDPALRAPRLVEAGSLAMLAGQPELSRTSLDAAVREATDPEVIAVARGARAHLEMWTGSVIRAREMLTAQAEQLQQVAPPAAATMLVDAAIASAMAGEPRAGRAYAERAATTDQLPNSLRAIAGITVAAFHGMCGEPDFRTRVKEMPDPFEGLSGADPLDWVRVSTSGQVFTWIGTHETAEALFSRLIGVGSSSSAPSMLPYLLAARSELRFTVGDWDGALADATQSLALADETSQGGTAAFAQCQIARLAAGRGREGECREMVRASLASVNSNEAMSVTSYAHAAIGLLCLGQGKDELAVSAFEKTFAHVDDRGLRSHPVCPFLPDMAEAAVRAGDQAAASHAAALLGQMDLCGLPRTQAAIARCAGLLEADHTAAAEHLSTAAAIEDETGLPFEAARSRLLLGERLLRAQDRETAMAVLRRAYRTFDGLAAAPWADRAADALSTLRARPRRRATAPVELTAKELQVAHAVAEGLTNKEIAARLFLSVKTVEFHLRNAYAKAGVRSRTELASHLRRTASDDEHGR